MNEYLRIFSPDCSFKYILCFKTLSLQHILFLILFIQSLPQTKCGWVKNYKLILPRKNYYNYLIN